MTAAALSVINSKAGTAVAFRCPRVVLFSRRLGARGHRRHRRACGCARKPTHQLHLDQDLKSRLALRRSHKGPVLRRTPR
jgi:hypothetical protein